MSKQSTGSVLAGVLIAIGSIPITGWVISVMWRWFVVPLHVPQIGIAHAMGLSLLLAAIRPRKYKNDDDKSVLSLALEGALTPLVTLALGALAHWLAT